MAQLHAPANTQLTHSFYDKSITVMIVDNNNNHKRCRVFRLCLCGQIWEKLLLWLSSRVPQVHAAIYALLLRVVIFLAYA